MGRTRNLEKLPRKNKKSTIINVSIIIIAIIIMVIISYSIITNYKSIQKKLKENKELTAEVNRLKNDNINELKNKEVLNQELAKYDKLDEEIAKAKEEVFKLAQELETKINNKETNYKIAYITFDDGPYYATDRVLAILKEHKIKATFFTIGLDKDTCYDNPRYSCAETYKKIVDNGHTIANHTYSHAIFRGLYSNADSFMNQVKLQQDLIEKRTGAKTNILRFPGGIGTSRAIAGNNSTDQILKRLKENGYGWVDWTAQDGDGGYLPDYSTGWKNLTGSINENIEVILFHDYSGVTISLFGDAIKYLEDRNYILLPLFYESVKVNK